MSESSWIFLLLHTAVKEKNGKHSDMDHSSQKISKFRKLKKIKISASCAISSNFKGNYKDAIEISRCEIAFLAISNTHKIKSNKMKALISMGYVLYMVVFHDIYDQISPRFHRESQKLKKNDCPKCFSAI